MTPLKAPFPYFGGKSRIGSQIWQRFGDTVNYVEPFAGSLAILLSRPYAVRTETVNDADCMISNFWRALQSDPDAVTFHADHPVNECDLHARHRWLVFSDASQEFRERMKSDPDYYDAKIAGWWVWGISQWIGSGWCSPSGKGNLKEQRPPNADAGKGVAAASLSEQLPHLSDAGPGVCSAVLHQKRPHLANKGKGIAGDSLTQQIPNVGNAGRGVLRARLHQKLPELSSGRGVPRLSLTSETSALHSYLLTLSARLRCVRVCCGDWSRVMGPSVTEKHGVTAILLDPPYSAEADRAELYAQEDLTVAHDVREWSVANGDNPLLRIAICGYLAEHDAKIPANWERLLWKTAGGYGSQAKEGRGRKNAAREVVWFSPHCLKPIQGNLFAE